MTQELLPTTVRLTSAVEALAALAAFVRTQTEDLDVDPEIGRVLGAIARELTGSDTAPPPDAAMQALGMTRAFLREAVGLVDDPGRNGDWSTTDPEVLQGLGRVSMGIATAFATVAPSLPGLHDALGAPGARILDVGTGTAWLAVALARTFPHASVVGIDIWDPALALARANVEREGVADRVELREADVTDLGDDGVYDAIWLPLPFLPEAVVAPAIAGARTALKPGGWLLAGTFPAPGDPLGDLLIELRIRRCGGRPWSPAELVGLLEDDDMTDVQVPPRTWPAPVELFVGRRPTAG